LVGIFIPKKYKFGIQIPGFRPNFQNTKKKFKKRKRKNVFVHTTKCLKAKKNHIVFFHTPKNNVLACILALITSLLKSREHWPKFQKQQKFDFVCLSIWGTTLHVIYIPDINFFFRTLE